MEYEQFVLRGNIVNRLDSLDFEGLRENDPQKMILHSTYSYSDFEDLLSFHKSLGWKGVGYHLFVSESGQINYTRPFNTEGAHALGHNFDSIGICYFSNNGEVSKKNVKVVKGLIKDVREIYGDIGVLSHTQAQIGYMNRLFAEEGLDYLFNEGSEIVSPEGFEKIQEDLSRLVGGLDTSKYPGLKGQIKGLKNCPGESFKNFIT